MKNINDKITVLLTAGDPLRDGFLTLEIIGIAYEPIVYTCKVLECVGSKEFKKDEQVAINAYSGEILVNENREKKDGLFISELFGLQTGQWCLI